MYNCNGTQKNQWMKKRCWTGFLADIPKRPQSLLMAFTRQARNLEGDFQISFQQLTTKITDRCHHLESRASNISSPPNVQRSTEGRFFFQFGQNCISTKMLYCPSFLREINQLLVPLTMKDFHSPDFWSQDFCSWTLDLRHEEKDFCSRDFCSPDFWSQVDFRSL